MCLCSRGGWVGGWVADAPGIFSQRIEPKCNLFCVIVFCLILIGTFFFMSVREVGEMRFMHTLSNSVIYSLSLGLLTHFITYISGGDGK